MKGSSLEAKFPLALCRTLIRGGETYRVAAKVAYVRDASASHWKWQETDHTKTKQLVF